MNYTFNTHVGYDGLIHIQQQWTELLRGNPSYSYAHTYLWYEAYTKHLAHPDREIYFITLHADGNIVAIVPLEYTNLTRYSVRLKALQTPNHSHFELSDIIISNDCDKKIIINRLIDYIKTSFQKNVDVIILEGFSEDSSLFSCLKDRNSIFDFKTMSHPCDILPVNEYTPGNKRFSKNLRANIKKSTNKIKKESGILFKQHITCDDARNEFVNFINVESSGWKGASGTNSAISLHKDLYNFYSRLIDNFCPTESCSINSLEIDGKIIASQFSLIINETVYLLKIGYNEEHAKYSPGNLLLDYIVQEYRESGKCDHINLITDASWHKAWKPIQLKCFNHYIIQPTFGGIIFLIACHLITSIKYILKRGNSKQ